MKDTKVFMFITIQIPINEHRPCLQNSPSHNSPDKYFVSLTNIDSLCTFKTSPLNWLIVTVKMAPFVKINSKTNSTFS